MLKRTIASYLVVATACSGASALAQQIPSNAGPYRVLKTVKVGGDGGFDWPFVDSDSGKLYIPRTGNTPRISIYELSTLKPAREIPDVGARAVAVDSALHTAFSSSTPVAMWNTLNDTVIKKIPVDGRPAGIFADAFNHRIYVQGRSEPGLTVIDAKDGSVLGTIPVGGEIEQTASDDAGLIYVDIEDRQTVVVIDSRNMKILTTYSLNGKGSRSEGMALDAKNHILFVASRDPQVMLILDAITGKEIAELPIGRGCSAVAFNPKTSECFSSQADGTLTIIKENSPTSFSVKQTVSVMPGSKRLTLDPKTGYIYLIAAEYEKTAEPVASAKQPGEKAAAPTMKPGSFTVTVVGQ